jgi:hypothetical protein
MKKFFSLIAAVLFAGSMMAAEVTITPGSITAAENTEISAVVQGVSFELTTGTVTAEQIRIFKNQTLTLSAGGANITKVVFTCTANGTAKYGPGCFAAQEGYTFEAEGKTGTWEGSAASVEFLAETNQVRATSIVVTFDGDAPEPEIVEITINSGLAYADYCASDGWWQMFYEGADMIVSLSNNYRTEAPGTYTMDDLDASYCYVKYLNPEKEISFTSGEIVLAEEGDKVTIKGDLVGNDGNIYRFDLTYGDPTAEREVDVVITNGEVGLYESSEMAVISGTDDNGVFVQLVLYYTGGAFEGDFTEEYLYSNYSVIAEEEDVYQSIFSADINVVPGNANSYKITATVLCYNNTQYNIDITVPGDGTGINNTEAAVKAVKRILNGQLMIEKNGVRYNANGAVVR